MKKILFLFMTALLLLIGCNNVEDTKDDGETAIPSNGDIANEEVKEPGEKKETPKNNEEKTDEVTTDLTKYFKPDNSTAYFLGEGNEFATYIEKTTWLADNYVATIIDNGGVTTLTIYKINKDKIDKIFFEPLEVPAEEITFPTVEELESMEVLETYLAAPIKVGTEFGDWKIVEVGLTLETPYETFENVFVIEEVQDDYVNRKYFAENYGDIKSEFLMETDGEEPFTVTSVLEKME